LSLSIYASFLCFKNLKLASLKGAITKNGREMLEIQAEENWKLWNQE
jgi:shikimate 5-dehydrogenase